MKRIVAVVLSALVALCMFGCAKRIEGTPADVIDECRSLKSDESAIVTVTGYVADEDIEVTTSKADGNERVFINVSENKVGEYEYSSGETFYEWPDIYVICAFEDEEEFEGVCNLYPNERITVTGELITSSISDDYLFITDCTLE